ncbi:MAG: transcriptional regulator [Ardenticatenaceae bacterium]|nr:transcriptional regulator [Ardenticatenaceae bacterium]
MFTFIESSIFAKYLSDYLSDDEYANLQNFLIANPEVGRIVPGSGGVRKMRWHTRGRGKSGGIRVIYYLQSRKGEIWLLTIYGKSAKENIPGHILKRLKEAFENE